MKFSIIIATYNAEKYLLRALASINSQRYPNYEIIVQDGNSSDATVNLLEKYFPAGSWRSEKDTGIYDAWNKALDRASGDWAIFLGADDCFMGENVLLRCYHHIKKMPANIMFAYGAMAEGVDGKVTNLVNKSLLEVYRRFSSSMGLPFPATFVKLPLVKKYKFDTSYKIGGDFDFAGRFFTHSNIGRIPVVVSYMEQGGISTNPATRCLMLDERGKVLHKQILPKAQEIVMGCMQYYWDEDMSLEQLSS